jgi:ubiquinone/menaquinone biosynthesis C-methylase UbiE
MLARHQRLERLEIWMDSEWDQMFARQQQRAFLLPDWLVALDLAPGECVLDVGAGTGFFSLQVAALVGPGGRVYAVDRSPEALAYIERLQAEQGLRQIHRVTADAAQMPPADDRIDAALLTMVLHHADDPAVLIAHVATLLPPGARLVIAEFHPDGPGETGPTREARIAPAQVESWCRAGGLEVVATRRQSPEHYFVAARVPAA